MKKRFIFDEVTKKATVLIFDKGKRYKGVAVPHKDDLDIVSKYTGLTIADARAELDRHERKAKGCSNEIKKLQKQIMELTIRQADHIRLTEEIKAALKSYIADKEEFAQKLRKVRSKNQTFAEKLNELVSNAAIKEDK